MKQMEQKLHTKTREKKNQHSERQPAVINVLYHDEADKAKLDRLFGCLLKDCDGLSFIIGMQFLLRNRVTDIETERSTEFKRYAQIKTTIWCIGRLK